VLLHIHSVTVGVSGAVIVGSCVVLLCLQDKGGARPSMQQAAHPHARVDAHGNVNCKELYSLTKAVDARGCTAVLVCYKERLLCLCLQDV
jgi:hypothetical protein